MRIFLITNLRSGASFPARCILECDCDCSEKCPVSLSDVWNSHKYLFLFGTAVRIDAEDGRSEVFIKE